MSRRNGARLPTERAIVVGFPYFAQQQNRRRVKNPDAGWASAAQRLLARRTGLGVSDLHYRAYLRAVVAGNSAQATHLVKGYAGAKAARADLIDEYGKGGARRNGGATQTYDQARKGIIEAFRARGWAVSTLTLKVPYVTSPNGLVRFWFKTQAIYYTDLSSDIQKHPSGRHEIGNGHTVSYDLDIRKYKPDSVAAWLIKSFPNASVVKNGGFKLGRSRGVKHPTRLLLTGTLRDLKRMRRKNPRLRYLKAEDYAHARTLSDSQITALMQRYADAYEKTQDAHYEHAETTLLDILSSREFAKRAASLGMTPEELRQKEYDEEQARKRKRRARDYRRRMGY